MGVAVIKNGIVLLFLLLLQLELFSSMRFFGVMPELLLASAIAAGWYGGPTSGAIVGFSSGLFYDFYLATPLGLNALTYAIVGYLLGQIAVFLSDEAEWIIRITISVSAVAVGLVLFVTFGELIAEPNLYNQNFGKILVISSLYTGLLMVPIHFMMAWAFGASRVTPAGFDRGLR